MIVKFIFCLALVTFLTSCASMMTPEQHQIFAKDWITLDVCNKAGLIPHDLSAQAIHLYRFRLQNYKYKEELMKAHMDNYYHQISRTVNPSLCRSYAAHVYSEILDRQQAQADMAQLAQTINNIGNTYASSSYQYAQIYNNATQNINNMSITPIQPLNIGRGQSRNTTCMQIANGMYNCQTK